MSACPETERFAALLRSLKSRSGLSYEALARKSGLAGSTLHRYCRGTSVPQDYGSAHRLATVCGATPEELRTLHRLWALADAARAAAAGAGEAEEHTPDDETAEPIEDTNPAASPAADPAGNPAPDPAGNPGPNRAGEPGRDRAGNPAPDPAGNPGPNRAGEPGRDRAGEPGADRAGEPGRDRAGEPGADPVGESDAAPRPRPAGWSRRRRLRTSVVTAALIAAVSVCAWALSNGRAPVGGGRGTGDDRPLFSVNCPPVIAMGEHDGCVREVQRLLHAKGADIGVDGNFGPQTLRRVTAFQVLAGLQPNGVVGEPTKKALYTSRVRMDVWSPRKVRQRVREVFPEVPDKAVAIADCQSFLDPLHILPNTNGTRNWGVFQISDARLRELGGTPREALDPEWNIQAARKLWSRDRDFGDWPHCERAADAPRSPTPRHSPATTRPPR
ncbi:helix-turn-helix domain-containing protein [Streptomyces sp. NPDC096046]|uniref:helix-turn-helix domain-containing protein n=1 Tax=Streptomyces sp. NPDC096046 TaxID=3155542 RepID=UPI00331B07D8